MDMQKFVKVTKRWEAMTIDYSKSGKELKSQIKKEYEEAIKYLNSLSKEDICHECKDWKHERLWIGYKFCPYCGRTLDN